MKTPETDALYQDCMTRNGEPYADDELELMRDHAMKLERERDEAIRQRDEVYGEDGDPRCTSGTGWMLWCIESEMERDELKNRFESCVDALEKLTQVPFIGETQARVMHYLALSALSIAKTKL